MDITYVIWFLVYSLTFVTAVNIRLNEEIIHDIQKRAANSDKDDSSRELDTIKVDISQRIFEKRLAEDLKTDTVQKRHTSYDGSHAIEKRGSCENKYRAFSKKHSACLDVETLADSGVSSNDRESILDKHNELRGSLKDYGLPTATDMLKMYWNDEIAMIAQKWADNCQFKHDKNYNRNIPGGFSVGQNIALGYPTWDDAITDWFNEYKDFEYGKGSTGGSVGHFTQVVAAKSYHIGCGFAKCPDLGDFYVCNYGPARGKPAMSTPYSSGEQGSACPDTLDSESGLCDCGNVECYNGGNPDPNTCKCQCISVPHVKGPNCSLDCSLAEDVSHCAGKGGPFGEKQCKAYENVPYQYCPLTCHLC